jgi:hypothetical protein
LSPTDVEEVRVVEDRRQAGDERGWRGGMSVGWRRREEPPEVDEQRRPWAKEPLEEDKR